MVSSHEELSMVKTDSLPYALQSHPFMPAQVRQVPAGRITIYRSNLKRFQLKLI